MMSKMRITQISTRRLKLWIQVFVALWICLYLIFYHRVVKRVLRRALSHHKEAPPPTGELLAKWSRLEHPQKPIGLSCSPLSSLDTKKECKVIGLAAPCPIFQARNPAKPEKGSSKIALVVQFEESDLSSIIWTLKANWYQFPPCNTDSKKLNVDLVFYTEKKVSKSVKAQVLSLYHDLGSDNVGCFANEEPKFLSPNGLDPSWSDHERSAYAFYSLFPLLETKYKSFMHYKPGMKAVRPFFLNSIVQQAKKISCESDGFWQIGYALMKTDLNARKLGGNNVHQMGVNSFYVLGCPDFEEYKCRVQTYYTSKDNSRLVAGYRTDYESGYERAMSLYRMQPVNYEYSRLILHRFQYSTFVQDARGIIEDTREMINASPLTYFIDHETYQ